MSDTFCASVASLAKNQRQHELSALSKQRLGTNMDDQDN